jgi:hypothetical protein
VALIPSGLRTSSQGYRKKIMAETSASGWSPQVLAACEGPGQPVSLADLNRYNAGFFGPLAATATGAGNDSLALRALEKADGFAVFCVARA